MNRSVAINIFAVILFIGSALTLLFAAILLLGLRVGSILEGQPVFIKYVIYFLFAIQLGIVGWAVATGIGLWRHREWGRISILVLSGILLFFTLPGLPMIAFMPLAQEQPEFRSMHLFVRIFMVILYGGLSALGGWWLYFFTRKSVRDEFRGGASFSVTSCPPDARPLSITIIGFLLLITACFGPSVFLLPVPTILMGFAFTGRTSQAVMLLWSAAAAAAGYGLLKLKLWGRRLAIGYFVFGIVNAILSISLPGSHAREEQVRRSIEDMFQVHSPVPSPPMWWGLVLVLPVLLAQLWFVVARKEAFLKQRNLLAPRS